MIRLKRAFVICMAVMLGTICAAGCASDEKKEDSKLPGYVGVYCEQQRNRT